MSSTTSINKEDINALHFISYEVLDNDEQKSNRKSDLEKAMKLGNSDHGKVKIVFAAETGYFEVETTVWASTDGNVTLKGGVTIPIHCISKVNFH
jgi:hypothetical protein